MRGCLAKCSQNAGIGIIATNTTMFVVFKLESGVDILSDFQSKCFYPQANNSVYLDLNKFQFNLSSQQKCQWTSPAWWCCSWCLRKIWINFESCLKTVNARPLIFIISRVVLIFIVAILFSLDFYPPRFGIVNFDQLDYYVRGYRNGTW